MINITLPDGSQRQFENPVTVGDVAASIGAGLAKAALAGKVGDKLVDTSYRIEHDASLAIITEKSPEALDILRHSTAHLLAQATQRLFPDTQVTIGPVVENGFYYDFARKTPFTPEDLDKIEAEMKKIVAESLPVERRVMRKDDAIKFFKDKGEVYKAQIIDEIIPPGEEISLYGQGDWVDLPECNNWADIGLPEAYNDPDLASFNGALTQTSANDQTHLVKQAVGVFANNDAAGRAFHRVVDRTVGCSGQTTALHLDNGSTQVWSFDGGPAGPADENWTKQEAGTDRRCFNQTRLRENVVLQAKVCQSGNAGPAVNVLAGAMQNALGQ